MEKKYVIAGAHGPVAMEINSRRFIDKEPVEVEMSAYYLRRIAEGELIESKKRAPAEHVSIDEIVASNPDVIIDDPKHPHKKGR